MDQNARVLSMERKIRFEKESYRFVVDRQSRYIWIDGCLQQKKIIESQLLDLGLKILDETVVPHDVEHRSAWSQALSDITEIENSNLVVVRSPPTLQCVLFSHLYGTDNILVQAPARRACSSDTIHEVSKLLGITERERQILELIANGHEPKSISKILGTSLYTVRTQVKSLFAKTGTSGMRDIIVWISGLSEARIIASFGEERDRRLGNLEFERRNYDRTFKSDLH